MKKENYPKELSEKRKSNKSIITGMIIFGAFILLVISLTFMLSIQHEEKTKQQYSIQDFENQSRQEIIENLMASKPAERTFKVYYFLPFVSFFSLILGAVIFYLMSSKIENTNEKLKKNTKIVLRFLSNDEKKVVEKLIDNQGRVSQSKLSYLPGLNKVKSHRLLKNLEQKGVISKEKLGKINEIILNKDIYDVLKD